MSRRGNYIQLRTGQIGPVGDVAELAVSTRSRHCLLFTGLSFNLFNPHGCKQEERVLWAWHVPELHRLYPAPVRPFYFMIATLQFL